MTINLNVLKGKKVTVTHEDNGENFTETGLLKTTNDTFTVIKTNYANVIIPTDKIIYIDLE
jgi:hypothetical protein